MNKQQELDYYREKAKQALKILYNIPNTADEAGKPGSAAWGALNDAIDIAYDSVSDILTAISDVEDTEEEDNE